jgi:dolichol-phosphate mannosyltransferase
VNREDCGGRGAQEPLALAVVVPMLNERAAAENCVKRVTEVLRSFEPAGILIVVDDGSTDGTSALLDDLGKEYTGLAIVRHQQNLGYGAALKSGAQRAATLGANWVLFMDSDLTNPPEDIVRFVEAMSGPVDYVKASRYAAGGEVRGVPLGRRAVSYAGNAVSRRLCGLPLSDLTNGFRAIRVELFAMMPLHERGFPMIMEEAYWVSRMGLRAMEIPTVLTIRGGELRRSSFRYRPGVLYSYGRYPVEAFAERVKQRLDRAPIRDGGSPR